MEVKIWFSAEQAKYIKDRQWSKTQTIEERGDGSIILSMTTSGWWDVKSWVLSYGAHARVLEPGDLRSEIVEDLSECLAQY